MPFNICIDCNNNDLYKFLIKNTLLLQVGLRTNVYHYKNCIMKKKSLYYYPNASENLIWILKLYKNKHSVNFFYIVVLMMNLSTDSSTIVKN